MTKNHIVLALSIGLSLLTNALWAAEYEKDSQPIPEATNIRSIAKLKSVRTGTAFVIHAEGRMAYMLTAAHVVGGRSAEPPDCQIEFDAGARRAPCEVRYVWSNADLAVVYANLEGIPGALKPLELGDSALLATSGARVYTAGYPGGGKLKIDRGFVSGAEPPKFILKGIIVKDGQSGSPVFSESDGKVVGMILERPLDGSEQRASEIDSIKLYLRQQQLFQFLILFTRPPSGATGPLVPSDIGVSLANVFLSEVSPHRWFDRAKRYHRTDYDTPTIVPADNWLGVRREYLASSRNKLGSFGRGWTSQFDYRIDIEHSDICNLHLWNPKNNRIILSPPHECDKVKDAIASHVDSRDVLQGSLGEIMGNKDLADNILPSNVSFTGADFEVLRARFVIGGIEVIIGSTKYMFNDKGKLRRVEVNSRDLELDYDVKGRLSVVRDGERTQEFIYLNNTLVSAVRYNDGTEFTYTYSADNLLTEVNSSSGFGYRYEYNRDGLLVKVKGLEGEEGPGTWIIGYSPEGQRTSVKHEGKEYRWRFTESDNDMPSIDMDIFENAEVLEKRTFQFDYRLKTLTMMINGNINIYKLTECLCLPLTVKSNEENTAYIYDPFGRLTDIKHDEMLMSYEYDDRFNKVTKFKRWFRGTLTETVEATYDSKGNLAQAKSSDGQSMMMTFDKEGRIASIKDETGPSIRLVYNMIGKPILITREGLGEIAVSYKKNGDILKVDSKEGPSIAMQIASSFNKLLDIIAPITAGAQIDSRFSILTSEPGGCDECARYQGD